MQHEIKPIDEKPFERFSINIVIEKPRDLEVLYQHLQAEPISYSTNCCKIRTSLGLQTLTRKLENELKIRGLWHG